MNLFHEYALLFAVAIPFVAIVGLNAFLWLGGERGTLLAPSARPFPVEEPVEAPVQSPAVMDAGQAWDSVAAAPASANDEYAREAA